MKRPVIPVVLVAVVFATVTSSCHRADDLATSDTSRGEAASGPMAGASDANPVALTDAYIVLPAVRGRPGAGYFTVTNRTNHPVTLVGVAIAGAKQAEMHQTSQGAMVGLREVDIPSHGRIAFAPGARHVMIFGLPAALHAGATTTLTVTFKDGETLSTTVAARAAGSGGGDAMPGMKMR